MMDDPTTNTPSESPPVTPPPVFPSPSPFSQAAETLPPDGSGGVSVKDALIPVEPPAAAPTSTEFEVLQQRIATLEDEIAFLRKVFGWPTNPHA